MLGVLVAIGAEVGLYLSLRRIAVATMPAWAHLHGHHPRAMLPYPSVVGVDVVKAVAGPAGKAPTPMVPALQTVPVVAVPPPDVGP